MTRSRQAFKEAAHRYRALVLAIHGFERTLPANVRQDWPEFDEEDEMSIERWLSITEAMLDEEGL